jgi:hypothetical protein
MKRTVIFTCILALSSVAFAEKHHAYETAKVISQDFNTYNRGAVAMPIGTMIAAVPIVRRSNIVVIENGSVRYTWSEVGNKTLILPVGGTFSFYRDSNYFVVSDSRNKKHKFALTGMAVN